jgi:O-antigen/teichoic acid export membrane protein
VINNSESTGISSLNSSKTTTSDDRSSSAWDIQNAPKNYISLVLTQGGGSLFAFASVWLIFKMLGSQGYGNVVGILAASQIAQVLFNWTGTAVVKFGTEEFIETQKIARTFWLRLFILIPNLLLVIATSKFWFAPLSEWLKISPGTLWLVILHFTASAFWIHIFYSLQGAKMPRLPGVLQMVERLLIFGGLLFFLIIGNLTPRMAALCYAISPLIVFFIGFFYLRNVVFTRFTLDWHFLRKIVIFSLPLLPFLLTWYFSSAYIDALFLTNFLSVEALGVYSIATQISGMVLQLPTLASFLLLPLFVSLQKENEIQKTIRYFKFALPTFILTWGFFCTILAFSCYYLLPLVFGRESIESTYALWILLASSTFYLPVLLGYNSMTHTTSTTYISMFSSIFGAVTNIIFNFLLIPILGLEGCAWATALTFLVNSLTLAIFLAKTAQMPVSWTFAAMIPAASGALCFSTTKNPLWSSFVCFLLVLLTAWLKRNSLKEAFNFSSLIAKRLF